MRKFFILSVLLTAAFGINAQPVPQKAMYVESRDSGFYTFYYDKAVSVDGRRTYRIVTAVPKKASGKDGYPALYAVDGNAVIHHITEKQLGKLSLDEPPVVVMIGYDTDELFDMPSRTYDFTPKRSDGSTTDDPLEKGRIGGGADVFLDFIENTVFPLSEKRALIDKDRRTLYGHSYGGLFVMHTLLQRPGLFKNFVSADPAMWWQDGDFYKCVTGKKEFDGLSGKNIYLLKSGESDIPSDTDNEKVRLRKKLYAGAPADASLTVIRRLSAEKDVRTQYTEYGYLSHGPLFPVSVDFALKISTE